MTNLREQKMRMLHFLKIFFNFLRLLTKCICRLGQQIVCRISTRIYTKLILGNIMYVVPCQRQPICTSLVNSRTTEQHVLFVVPGTKDHASNFAASFLENKAWGIDQYTLRELEIQHYQFLSGREFQLHRRPLNSVPLVLLTALNGSLLHHYCFLQLLFNSQEWHN